MRTLDFVDENTGEQVGILCCFFETPLSIQMSSHYRGPKRLVQYLRVKIFHFLEPDQKLVSVPEPSHFSPPSTDHSKGARTASLSPQGERVTAGGNYIPLRRP